MGFSASHRVAADTFNHPFDEDNIGAHNNHNHQELNRFNTEWGNVTAHGDRRSRRRDAEPPQRESPHAGHNAETGRGPHHRHRKGVRIMTDTMAHTQPASPAPPAPTITAPGGRFVFGGD